MNNFTFEPHLIVYMALYLIVFTLYYVFSFKKRGTWLDKHVIINAFFIFYLLSVFRFVFTPFSIWSNVADQFSWWEIANVNLIPFRSLIQTLSAPLLMWRFTLLFVVGNFILLFPLPIFVGLLSKKEFTFKKALLIGFLATLFIESGQLIINLTTGFPNRLVCVDDLLLNTLGAICGYFIFKKCQRFFEKIISLIYKFLTWS